MSLKAKSDRFLYGLIFLGLWAIFVVIDRYVIGMELPYLIEDHETGEFSVGLNWLTLEPRLWSHHTSPIIDQISGLVTSLLNIDGTDKPVEQFTRITIGLQGVFAFVAGIWFSWASDLIGLNRWHRALLIFLVFTFPTLVFISGHWSYSYAIGLFGLPLGITLVAVLQENRNAITVGGIGLGLLAANSYLSILILALFVLTMSLQKHRTFALAFPKLKRTYSKDAKSTIALLGVCAIAFSFGAHYSGVPILSLFVGAEPKSGLSNFPGVGGSLVFGLVLWLTSSFLVLLLARADAYIERFLLWTVGGFIAGNFILLPWYFHGLGAAQEKSVGLTETVNRLTTNLLDYPWVLVVWFSVLSICLVLCLFLFGKWKTLLRSEGLVYGAVFALVGTIVIALLSTGPMEPLFADKQIPGMGERIFVGAIPALTVGWVILFRSLRGAWLQIFQITLVFLSLFSLAHFYQAYSNQVAENKHDGLLLDGAIESFFEKYPKSRLVCINGVFYSRYCGTVKAYNRYREVDRLKRFGGPSAKAFLPVWRVFDGKVIGLNVDPIEGSSREYNAGVVEERLTSCRSNGRGGSIASFCYGDYVRNYPDLLAAFTASNNNASWFRKVLGGGQSINQWGRSHYQSIGEAEGRTLPTPLEGPLFVVTVGGHYRNSLIRFLGENQMTVVPLWQWWEKDRNKRGQPFTNIPPGDSFLVFPLIEKPTVLSRRGVSTKIRGKSTEEWSRERNYQMAKETYGEFSRGSARICYRHLRCLLFRYYV